MCFKIFNLPAVDTEFPDGRARACIDRVWVVRAPCKQGKAGARGLRPMSIDTFSVSVSKSLALCFYIVLFFVLSFHLFVWPKI